MISKSIKITVYDSEGKEVSVAQVEKLQRRADGCFTSNSSRTLSEGILEVEKGGAMFVERAWSK